MKYCNRHKTRKAALKVLWADGRAVWYSCGQTCLKVWKKKTGRWACVVKVSEVS
jgi:hypothetical protein